MVKWQIFRNFTVDNQIVMNKIKPLDQSLYVGAKAHNDTAKLQNKFGSQDSILYKIREFSSSVPDFRRNCKGNIRHRLDDIIMLIILARASGHTARADIIEFGRHNLNKFRKMGMLRNGVPSEATLCRADNGIDDLAMADRMQELAVSLHARVAKPCTAKEIICIDGKAERGTVLPNGRNPDIVSAYSFNTGIILAAEACQEKSNEITAVPSLISKTDISGKIVTADAMSMQKGIIDKVREGGGDFLIELKANQRGLLYGVEDRLGASVPSYSYKYGPELGHGRIETRKYRIYDGLGLIADKEKWGGGMSIIEYESETVMKSTGNLTTERRLYVSSLPPDTPGIGEIVRSHWSVESMHWSLDATLLQDKVKRKSARGARNLDTIQRIVFSVFSAWRGLRRKRSDKRLGFKQLIRRVSMSFTKLRRFLLQK